MTKGRSFRAAFVHGGIPVIKALFFDLDGTLLSSKKTLLPSSREALRFCREKGVRIFLATARSPMLDRMLGWAEEFSLFDGGIYCNGACCRIGGRNEYAFLASEAVRACIAATKEYDGLHIALHTENEIHAFNHYLPDSELDPWGLTRKMIRDIDDCPPDRVIKILLFYGSLFDTERKLPGELLARLRAEIGGLANLYLLDGGRTIQLSGKDVSKLSAIEKICARFGFAPDEIAVFGDDRNDMEMLARCPNSVAMGNAPDEVKNAAAFVTKTNDENSIAFALKELLHII